MSGHPRNDEELYAAADLERAEAQRDGFKALWQDATAEAERLRLLLNTPELEDFAKAVPRDRAKKGRAGIRISEGTLYLRFPAQPRSEIRYWIGKKLLTFALFLLECDVRLSV